MGIRFVKRDADGYLQHLEDRYARSDIRSVVLHHTLHSQKHWSGLATMEMFRRCHLDRGGRDIFATTYTGPDGSVWEARTPDWGNKAHALRDKPKGVCADYAWAMSGGDRMWWNHYAMGVETEGDYRYEDPTTSRAMETSLRVIAGMMDLWRLPTSRLTLHTDVAYKSCRCPGWKVSRDWALDRVESYRAGGGPSIMVLKVVLLPATLLHPWGRVVDCAARLAGDTTTCALRPLAKALGYDVSWEAGRRMAYLCPRNAVVPVPALPAAPSPQVVLLPEGRVLPCEPTLEAGVLRGGLRVVAEALGHEVGARLDQKKVYLRPRGGD